MDKTLDRNTVKRAIKAKGLKKGWIAERIGVSKNTLGDFLADRRMLSRPAQILLAQVLELNEASDKAS